MGEDDKYKIKHAHCLVNMEVINNFDQSYFSDSGR